MENEVDWGSFDRGGVFERFRGPSIGPQASRNEVDFEFMTRFDFNHLLPALLQVEDRMSMAHGLESRVPLLDSEIVEFVATIPAALKFKGGQLKHFLTISLQRRLPRRSPSVATRWAFRCPLNEWLSGPLQAYVSDIFASQRARHRPFFDSDAIVAHLKTAGRYSRKYLGFAVAGTLVPAFHDRAGAYRRMIDEAQPIQSLRGPADAVLEPDLA